VGAYVVEARIGGGAMAAVYRARDTRDGRLVALKILLPDADENVRERFRQEARTVSILDHPHIVRTLEVGHGMHGLTYIAMEMVEGESLGELLDRVHALNAVDSSLLLAPIAEALAYAHGKNIVHRDVKPSNILLRPALAGDTRGVRISVLDFPVVPLLSDFGIARALDAPELTSLGRTIGTPSYMSPEQCAGSRDIDGRADIYSLGAVLYRSLVGRAPFVGSTTQILYAHVYEPVTLPEEIVRILPPLVLETLRLALAKEPEERFVSAQELARALGSSAGPRVQTGGAVVPATPEQLTMTMDELEPAPPTTTSSQVLVPAPFGSGGRPAQPMPIQPAMPSAGQPLRQPPGAVSQSSGTPGAVRQPYVPPAPMSPAGVSPTPVRTNTSLDRRVAMSPFKQDAQQTGDKKPNRLVGWLIALTVAIPLFVALGFGVAALLDMNAPGGTSTPAPTSAVAIGGLETTPTAQVVTATPATDVSATDADATANALAEIATQTAIAVATEAIPTPVTPAGLSETATAVAATMAAATATTEAGEPSASATPQGATPQPATDVLTDTLAITETTTLTGTPGPTPSGDIASYWEDAQALFAERDWMGALQWLTLMQRIDPEYEAESVATMRSDILVTLGAQAVARADIASADNYYNQALALTPENITLQSIQRATDAWLKASVEDRDASARVLQLAHTVYGQAMARRGRICDAADQFAAAAAVNPDSNVSQQRATLQQQCDQLLAAAQGDKILSDLEGRILYSTQVGDGSYRVYIADAAKDAPSAFLIDDATQPALSATGGRIAFHDTNGTSLGISGFTLDAGMDPSARTMRYARQNGDSRDSPPSWNLQGTRLVFANADEGGSRIFATAADEAEERTLLLPGLSPAWSWTANWIAYNGVDDEGNQPGLWVMRPDGTGRIRITDNGTDIRPAWSPDSTLIAFMANGRSGNWDVFTVSTETGAVTQITDDGAQDGLPVFSPDGKYILFASDRGGSWNLWIAPTAGGEAIRMMSIAGSLTNWLEHSIQWAR